MGERVWWGRVKQQGLVENLEGHGAGERGDGKCVCAETSTPQIKEETNHQDRGQLKPTQLRDELEQRVQRFLPEAVHLLGHLDVQRVEPPRGDRHRHGDESNRKRDYGQEPREELVYRWHLLQKKVLGPGVGVW